MTPANDDTVADAWVPRATALKKLPELELLARIAEKTTTPFAIIGSTARRLVNASVQQWPLGSSLFDFVDPFADIDVSVARSEHAHSIAVLIEAHIPRARFFRWRFRATTDLYRRLGRANAVHHTPAVAFGSDWRWTGGGGRLHVMLPVSGNGDEVLFVAESGKEVELSLASSVASDPADQVELLLDLLYLAREYPSLSDSAAPLREGLNRRLSSDTSEYLRHQPRARRRLEFSLLRLLLRRHANAAIKPLSNALGAEPLKTLMDVGAPTLRDLLSLHEAGRNKAAGVVAVVRPARRTLKRRIQVACSLRTRDWKGAARWLKAPDTPPTGPHSPLISLLAGEPPHPGCCRFRDFVGGVAEVVWSDPTLPPWPATVSGSSLFLLADGVAADETMPIVTSATFSRVSSCRFDWNFVNLLAAGPRKVQLIAVALPSGG